MKSSTHTLIGVSAFLFLMFSLLPAQDSRISGVWQGSLKVQGFELRIVFHLAKSEKGDWTATMDSPDQGATGIHVDSVKFSNEIVRLTVLRVLGVYNGKLEPGDSTIKGNWSQSGATFPLDLKRATAPIEVKRPQEPHPPYPYMEEEVTFPNKKAGIRLAGTLTLPKQGGPFAAVVMISGSGPQDRDENIFNHKPFKVIADDLTRNGIAVLRYDDRGKAGSSGDFSTATTIDFASDALAAIKYLKSRKDIDHAKIGLIGHSEGGLIAPMVAEESHDVGFIVLLAGPSLMGKDIILLQDSLISLANGIPIETIKKNREMASTMYSIVESESDTGVMRQKLTSFLRSAVKESEDGSASDKAREEGIARTVQQLSSPWFRFFLFYDPVPALMKVDCPVLALNGTKDLQVPFRVNLEGIERAVKEGGNSRVTIRELPGLNHLFQRAETGAPSEYVKIEETFAPEALTEIREWIRSVVKMK